MTITVEISANLRHLSSLINKGLITQKQLANATGVDQSQISRILSGKIRRVSTNVDLLCKYAKTLHIPASDTQNNRQKLTDAALQLWDGTSEHANELQKLFNTIAVLQEIAWRER